MAKVFLEIQNNFSCDVVNEYFDLIKMVLLFLLIPFEVLYQAFISLSTNSEKHRQMNDEKTNKERRSGIDLEKKLQ